MKIFKYQRMELSSERFSAVFPEFRRVALFTVYTLHPTMFYHSGVYYVIYQTRERVFHQDIQTPRSGLKKRGAAEFF